MAKEMKFNPIPESEIGKARNYNSIDYKVTLVVSSQMLKDGDGTPTRRVPTYNLLFPREVVWMNDMENKYFQFAIDTNKKAILWRIIGEKIPLESIGDYRLCKSNLKTGIWSVSIAKMINRLGITLDKSRPKIPVGKWKSPDILNSYEWWYIELRNEIPLTKEEIRAQEEGKEPEAGENRHLATPDLRQIPEPALFDDEN